MDKKETTVSIKRIIQNTIFMIKYAARYDKPLIIKIIALVVLSRAGKAVNGIENAQPGDVICYSGHVAIYDGHGGIVEAKGARWGICHDRSVFGHPSIAIRRMI